MLGFPRVLCAGSCTWLSDTAEGKSSGQKLERKGDKSNMEGWGIGRRHFIDLKQGSDMTMFVV